MQTNQLRESQRDCGAGRESRCRRDSCQWVPVRENTVAEEERKWWEQGVGAWEKTKRVLCNKECVHSRVQQEWRIQMGRTMAERKEMLGQGAKRKSKGWVGQHLTFDLIGWTKGL